MTPPEEPSSSSTRLPALEIRWDDVVRAMGEREAATQAKLADTFARFGPGCGCYQIPCVVCGRLVYRRTPTAKYCSYRCRAQAYVARRKARREQARQKQCAQCGNDFVASRCDARFCSNACRQASYRERPWQ